MEASSGSRTDIHLFFFRLGTVAVVVFVAAFIVAFVAAFVLRRHAFEFLRHWRLSLFLWNL
jgi:hypothetical protein